MERVLLVRPDEDGSTRAKGTGFPFGHDPTVSLQYEHLVLPRVIVLRGLTTWFDFDHAHRHVRHTIARTQ